MILLTCVASVANLSPLPHCSTGLVSRNQTAQAAIMRFFYARKLFSSSLLCRAGWALARVAGYVWPVDQPIQSGSMIGLMLSGLKLITNEVTIMTNHAQKLAESSQFTKKSLFNLTRRSPQGQRVICHDLIFEQAIGLIEEIPGTIVLKFSKMVGAV